MIMTTVNKDNVIEKKGGTPEFYKRKGLVGESEHPIAKPKFSEKAMAFLNKRPEKILGIVGASFYEHPTLGDEAPLVAIVDGKLCNTDFYDRPTYDEVLDFIKDCRKDLTRKQTTEIKESDKKCSYCDCNCDSCSCDDCKCPKCGHEERIDELSTKTLDSYRNKAGPDFYDRFMKDGSSRKTHNRDLGLARAAKKSHMVKRGDKYPAKTHYNNKYVEEDNLNELSNDVLNRYQKRSADEIGAAKNRNKNKNRNVGRVRARDRLDARGLAKHSDTSSSILSKYMRNEETKMNKETRKPLSEKQRYIKAKKIFEMKKEKYLAAKKLAEGKK